MSPEPGITDGELFRLVWRGWFAGLLVLFVPIWLLALIVMAFQGDWSDLVPVASGIILLPVIAAGQGLIIAGMIWLGLRVWPQKQTQSQE
jgi:hypothetical protein